MTAPDAMPERVWVVTSSSVGDGVVTAWDAWAEGLLKLFAFDDHCPDSIAYVKESHLLAAEARVREVEAEMNVMRQEVQLAHELAEDKAIATRAERDALVPLLRYFVEYVEDGMYEWEDPKAPDHACDFLDNPESGYCEFHDKWGEARAILAREAGK